MKFCSTHTVINRQQTSIVSNKDQRSLTEDRFSAGRFRLLLVHSRTGGATNQTCQLLLYTPDTTHTHTQTKIQN